MKKALIISVIAFVTGAAAGMLLSRHYFVPDREKTAQTDTIYLRDTNIYIGGSAGYDLIAKTPYIGIKAGIPIYSW